MTAAFFGAKRASVDLVLTRGKMYARSNTLWRQVGGAAAAALLDNRWVILPANSVAGFPFTNARTFIRLLKGNGGLGSVRKYRALGVRTTVNGQPAIKLSAGDAALYIATTGQPYPLEIRLGSGNALYPVLRPARDHQPTAPPA